MSEQVVVVGAGVIGLCAAHRLRRLGLEVTVVDRGEAGRGATWGNAGWLVPSLSAPIAGPGAVRAALRAGLQRDGAVRLAAGNALTALPWLVRFGRSCSADAHLAGLRAVAELARGAHESYAGLAAEGVDFTLRKDGLLSAYLDPERAERGRQSLAALQDFGYDVPPLLDGDRLRALEPVLSPEVGAGYLVEQEQAVDPVSLVAGLRSRLVADGVKLVEHWPVDCLVVRGGQAAGVRGPQGSLPADHVVVAAGAWSAQVLRGTRTRVPLQAGKGYGLTLRPTAPVTRSLYFPEGRIGAAPRAHGLRVAGVMDLDGLREHVSPGRARSLARVAGRYLRDLGTDAPREVWCGLRSVTPDGLPVIGPLPDLPNVTVAFGHAMLGVTLGAVTGNAIGALVTGASQDVPLGPFRPERFRRAA